jgi:hypothetical protein
LDLTDDGLLSTSHPGGVLKALDLVAPLWRGAQQIVYQQRTIGRAYDALTRAFSGADGI